jgi:V/A-type H+-transporting ATPase subunit E
MSLDKVVEEILRRGEQRKLEVIRQGEKDRDELIVQARKRIAENEAKGEHRTRGSIAQMEQQDVSSAELESKRMLLESQRKVMDELKEEILVDLAKIPADRRKKMYSKLVARAKSEFGECYVYSTEKDKALLQVPSGMLIGGTMDSRGGLIFESKDKTVRLDFRFETLLDDLWSSKMKEIYEHLFG